MWASWAVRPSTASMSRTATSAREIAFRERSVENRSAAGPEATLPRRRAPAGPVGGGDRVQGAERREPLRGGSGGDLAAPADAGRVGEDDLPATPRQAG